MRIDTHTHIPNLDGVDKLIYACADPKDINEVFLTAQSNKNIFATIGIHPDFHNAVPEYESILNNPKVVGIGEIGLDYHHGVEHKNDQIKLFESQLWVARKFNLPVAIHTRDAESDTADILKNIGGVLHCFTGTYDFAKIMLTRGFFVSASGIITFKNAADLRETFSKIPIDRIVSETDSPYCAPVPFRGQNANPSMVAETIKCLAEIKNLPLIEMEQILWDNAHDLYKKLWQDKL